MALPVVVQSSTVGKFSGSLTATATLTGVTAGNALIMLVTHFNGDASPTGGTTSCYDGAVHNAGTKFAFGQRTTASSSRVAEIHYKMSVIAGTHAVDSVAGFGTAANSSGQVQLLEISGLDGSQLVDATGSSANNTNSPQATTGTLSIANQICFSVIMGVTALTGATVPPASAQTTFHTTYSDLGASELATVFAWGTVSVTTAINANWSTLNSTTLTAVALATFKSQASGGFTMVADMGSFTRIGSPGTLDFYVVPDIGVEGYTGQAVTLTLLANPVMLAAAKNYVMTKEPNILTYVQGTSTQRTAIGLIQENNVAGMRTTAAFID